MKRGAKIGIGAVVTLLVVVVAAVAVVYFMRGSIIVAAIEQYGSEVLKVRVRLGSADLDPTNGKGRLTALFVGSPRGYKADSVARVGNIAFDVDIGTLTDDVIVIERVVVTRPVVTYELGGPAGDNMKAIQRNVAAYMAAERKKASDSRPQGEKETRLIIRSFIIRGGRVNVNADILGSRKVSANLAPIHLRNLGGRKRGATPGQIAGAVAKAVIASTERAIASINLKGMIKGLEKGAGGVVKGVEKGAGGAVKGVEKGVGGVGKKIKGIFK